GLPLLPDQRDARGPAVLGHRRGLRPGNPRRSRRHVHHHRGHLASVHRPADRQRDARSKRMNTPLTSLQWLVVTDALCVAGAVATTAAAVLHARTALGAAHLGRAAGWTARVSSLALWSAAAACLLSVAQRGVEVNHFPCQTMGEVLTVFSLMTLLS